MPETKPKSELRDLYFQYCGAIAYVSVRSESGDAGIGTAFHVGDGIFLTARHVVENKEISQVATTMPARVLNSGKEDGLPELYSVEPRILNLDGGPRFAEDPSVDVAVFRVTNADQRLPRVPLGPHLDENIGDADFVLSEVLVLGYPPIPFTTLPRQVAARGEVNAVVDLRHSRHVHFVISGMARGGFSGGLVLSENGYALGMVTESLGRNNEPAEIGFMSVLSVGALYRCIREHFDLAEVNSMFEVESSNLITIRLVKPSVKALNSRLSSASIYVYDDDRDVFGEVTCSDPTILNSACRAFSNCTPIRIVDSMSRPGYALFEMANNPSKEELKEAGLAARQALIDAGYTDI